MSESLGIAVLDLTTDMSRLDRGLGTAESTVRKRMGRFAGIVGKAIGAAVTSIAAIGAVITGLALKGGLDRALNIQDAQAKLRGLGHTTETIQTIMDSALASVKGTAFGLDEAATAAASAVAAGVEPGKELTRVLGLTADAATIMGREFGDSGAIVNKVLSANRLSMEEVNQLHDAGLPILSMLAEQYGVNASEMRDMISEGVVGSEEFLGALENIEGAALESGETVRGSLANMMAALSRVGEKVVGPLLPVFKKIFGGITGHLDTLAATIGEKVVPTIEKMADAFMAGDGIVDGFAGALGVLTGGDGIFESIFLAVQNFLPRLVEWLIGARIRLFEAALQLFPVILDAAIQFFPTLLDFLVNTAIPQILDLIVTAVPKLLAAAVELFTSLLDAVTTILPQLVTVLLVDVLPTVLTTILGMIPALLDAAVEAFTTLLDAVTTILPQLLILLLGTVLPNLVTTIVEMVPRLLDAGIQAFTALVSAIVDVLPELVDTLLLEVLPVVIDTIVDMIPQLLDAGILAFTALVDALIDVLPDLIFMIVTDLIPGVHMAIMDLVPKMFSAGVEIIQGLIDGFFSMFDAVGNAVEDVVSTVTDFLPFSPAKKGPLSGKGSPDLAGVRITEMLTEGITSGMGDVKATMSHLLNFGGSLTPAMAGNMRVVLSVDGRELAESLGPPLVEEIRSKTGL